MVLVGTRDGMRSNLRAAGSALHVGETGNNVSFDGVCLNANQGTGTPGFENHKTNDLIHHACYVAMFAKKIMF
jgi:hypothetical protein